MFEVEETQGERGLLPFTFEDAKEENHCSSCEYEPNCPIIAYVNKLSIKRDGRAANNDFGCTIFQEVDLEDEESKDIIDEIAGS